MKRVKFACLSQTIHFQLKEDIPRGAAVIGAKEEFEAYKQKLERSHTAYKIENEQIQDDGSIIVKIKKQVNNYEFGDYLD